MGTLEEGGEGGEAGERRLRRLPRRRHHLCLALVGPHWETETEQKAEADLDGVQDLEEGLSEVGNLLPDDPVKGLVRREHTRPNACPRNILPWTKANRANSLTRELLRPSRLMLMLMDEGQGGQGQPLMFSMA